MMTYDIKVWSVGGGKWRASVGWQGEQLFGEADTPALAIVQLGFYWEDCARNQDSDIQTLGKLLINPQETE